MITFYSEDGKPLGTLELVDGVLKATDVALDVVGPPERRMASDPEIYDRYRSWSNGYAYSREDSTDSE